MCWITVTPSRPGSKSMFIRTRTKSHPAKASHTPDQAQGGEVSASVPLPPPPVMEEQKKSSVESPVEEKPNTPAASAPIAPQVLYLDGPSPYENRGSIDLPPNIKDARAYPILFSQRLYSNVPGPTWDTICCKEPGCPGIYSYPDLVSGSQFHHCIHVKPHERVWARRDSIEDLKKTVKSLTEGLAGKFEGIEQAIRATESTVGGMEQGLDAHEGRVEHLESRVAALEHRWREADYEKWLEQQQREQEAHRRREREKEKRHAQEVRRTRDTPRVQRHPEPIYWTYEDTADRYEPGYRRWSRQR